MKKISQKLISLIMTVMMLVSVMPTSFYVSVANADDTAVLKPAEDTWTGDSTANCSAVQGVQLNGVSNDYQHLRLQSNVSGGDLSTARYASSMGYMKYDMSDFTDVKIKKATLNLYARSNNSAIKNAKMFFFKMANDWTESALTYFNSSLTPLSGENISVDVTGTNIEGRIQPVVTSPVFGVPAATADYDHISFDITGLMNKYNLIEDSTVSFAMMAHPTGYSVMAASKDHENEALHPYLEIETEPIEELSIISGTEGEVGYESEVKVSFNNILNASTITPDTIAFYEDDNRIELSEEDIIISETEITINKEKIPYMDYKLVISEGVYDIYGDNLDEEYALEFRTISQNTKVTYNNIFNSAHLDPTNPDSTRITNGAFYMYANKNYYPYYVEMDASKILESGLSVKSAIYEVKFNSSNQYFTVYFHEVNEDFDPQTVTYNTAPQRGEQFKSQFIGVTPATYSAIDLTDFINQKLAVMSPDDPYIRFAMMPSASTVQIYGDLMSDANRPKITIEYSNSSFVGVTASTPANGASDVKIDSDIKLTFSAGIDGVSSSNFVLRNTVTNEEFLLVDNEIEYDSNSHTVTINPKDEFEEMTSYELLITGITSGTAQLKNKSIKFITASRLNAGNILLTGADSIAAGSEINASVEVENTTTADTPTPTIALALYDGSLLKKLEIAETDEYVLAEKTKTLSASIAVGSDETSTEGYWAKAFLWDSSDSQKALTQSVSGGNVFENNSSKGKYFGDVSLSGTIEKSSGAEITLKVCDASGNIVYINQCTADSKGKYEFVLSLEKSGDYTAYIVSDKNFNASKTISLKDYTSYEDMSDVWTKINSGKKSDVEKAIVPSVKYFDIDIKGDLESVLNDVAQDIANHKGFGEYTSSNIKAYGEYLAQLCDDLITIESLLQSITDAKNYSTVSKILSDEENAKLLGIYSYYDEFADSKTTVSKALVGKKFDSLEDFKEKFKDALEQEEEKPKKNSGGGGGGGSSSGIIIGAASSSSQNTPEVSDENSEIIQTEEDYFVDSADVSWARKEIEFLYRMGVISGKGYRVFAPNDNVLREEYVKLIMLATELYKDGSECAFDDVQKTDWFYPYVASAVEKKVVSGISETMFGSGNQITRQDLAVMTVRVLTAMGYFAEPAGKVNLTDMDYVSDYAKDAVKFLNENAIINGTPEGAFNPLNYATRAETACIIYRTLEYIKANASSVIKPEEPGEEIPAGEYTFSTPTKAQVKADIEEILKNKSHPYLHADAAKLESIKQAVANKDDEYILREYAQTKADADSILSASMITAGGTTVSQSHISIRPRILTLMTVYYVEQDERYLKRAMKEFENLQNITEWNAASQLDNTMTAEAIATCYDWLYDYLSDDQKKWCETMVKERCLDISYEYYKDPNTLSFLRSQHNNMNIVLGRGSFNHAVYNNSNTLIAALAFAKLDPDYAATLIATALYNLEAYWELVSDGGFEEPSTYYHYCTGRAGYAMSAVYSALGTTYGYEKSPGFKNTAWFGLYMYGPMTFGDCHAAKGSFDTESLYLYAKLSRNPQMMKRIIDLDNGTSVDPLLWYTKGEHRTLTDAVEVPLDKLFPNPRQSTFVMRDQLDDDTNIFTGLYAGCANATGHSDAVSGLFCLDAFGERWITALGVGDYNLPGYFDNAQNGQRWTYYERRPEGGSCLVINPSEDVGQDVTKSAVIETTAISDGSAFAIANLEPVYHKEVTSYKRGLKLHNNRTQIVVQDEAVMKKPSKIFWSFNTPADVEIIDGNTAVMSIGSKKVAMKVWANVPFELYKMKAEALPTSPKPEGQKIFREYRKIAISAENVTELKLMVEFTPLVNEHLFPKEISPWIDLASWTADEKAFNKPLVDAIYVDGRMVDDFESLNYFYRIDPELYTNMPEITVDKNDEYNVSVIYPETFPGMFYIEVSDAEGNINYYSIDALEKEKPIDVSKFKKLNVAKVSASDNDGNVPENAVDGLSQTRWSASGDGAEPYLDIDLGSAEKIAALGISFYSGSSRTSYFEIQTSTDGKKWTKQLENGSSSGTSSDFENFSLGGVEARYIRYIGQQNSQNHWNSVTDIIVYGE